MSASPEVAITIMTGGHSGPTDAAGASTTQISGPEPTSLDRVDAEGAGPPTGAAAAGPEPIPLGRLAATSTGSTMTGASGTGPEPMSLDRLAAAAGAGEGQGSGDAAPTPTDLADAAGVGLVAPTPSTQVVPMSTGLDVPTPLDLDALAEQAASTKKAVGRKNPAKRAGRTDG